MIFNNKLTLLKQVFVFFVLFGSLSFSLSANEIREKLDISSELSQYQNFVKDVGDQITALFADKSKPLSQRKKDFHNLLRTYFSIKSIGKFVLARYWRLADEEQREEYFRLFEDSLVENYSLHFDTYQGETLEIISARFTNDNGVIVQSHVKRPRVKEPLIVDWKIFKVKEKMKIFDLIINGASMSISLRTEYNSLLQANGGTIGGLLAALKEKNMF